jgi:hypothetical protein
MVIHCIWVVGKAKKQGSGDKLLQIAIEDAKNQGMYGIVGMSAEKGGWVPNKKVFLKNGFAKVDEIEPNYALYAKYFDKGAPKPKFHPIDEKKRNQYSKGVNIIYTDQCPYITDLVEELKEVDKEGRFKAIKIDTCQEAQQNGIYPYGTYCIICDGNISLYKHTTKKEIRGILDS